MKKCLIFPLFVTLCVCLCLITADELSSQRGMKTINVRTKTGKEIQLYKNSYALVIGNGNYTNDWDPLNGALTDVEEVETLLKKHGFHVTLKKNLTKAKFDRAFAEFVLKSGEDANSRLLFYYAGHGYTRKSATDEDLGYLVMVDAPAPETDKVGFELESVSMESLVTQTDKILARHVLFVFDSCFSGTVLNVRDRLTPPESISDRVQYPIRQFITAGRAGEVVPDHSDFKQAFLDLLDGRAREPFPDGYITGEELGFYLKNQVPVYNPAQHPQYGKIRNPKLDKGDFVFVLQDSLPFMEDDSSGAVEVLSTTATLDVTSMPSGARVYVDDIQIGPTPLHGHEIDMEGQVEKQVKVGLELSGYKSRVRKAILKSGQSTPWFARLEKIRRPKPRLPTRPTPMVLIPAGNFEMGSNSGYSDEKPMHTVYVDAFHMDKYEVTNAQYQQFVNANPQWGKDRIPDKYHDGNYLSHWNGNSYPIGKENHPVVYVSWYGAMAYAGWAGKRLPTEAEWEKAARGGLVDKKYPWGDSINASHANYGENVGDTTAVGSYVSNGYGLHDMAGNVWEWCLDAYSDNFYARSPRRNPVSGGTITSIINNFTNVQNTRVLRGGSWFGNPVLQRVVNRGLYPPTVTLYSLLGFRCARD